MENNSFVWTDNPTVSGVSKCDTDVLNECLMHLKYDSQSGSGYSMFDIIQSDRILSYEESKGKALLGSWVYKKGAAGSRHGYPDFYETCLKEMEEGVMTPVKANVTSSGITFDEDFSYAVSGRNYASPGVIPLGTASSWEILIKAKTPSNFSSAIALTGDTNGVNYQYPEWRTDTSGKIILFLSSNGTSWNIAESAVSPSALESNKEYWFKLEFTGNQYIASHTTDEIITENTLWANDIIITSTAKIYTSSSLMAIGNHVYSPSNQYPWTGKIDLKNCRIKIGGEEYWRGTFNVSKHANMHMFCNADEKYILDKMYETSGSAWYYCVDKENERIFLPRNDWFFQSGSSVDVNKTVEAGLPNITGTVKSGANGGDYMGGAFYYLNSNTAGVSGRHDGGSDANYSAGTAGFSASRSSGVYGKSNTVQPNSVKQLYYMVVGNTETQSSLIDVVDITTSESDTLPLYFNTYSNIDLTTTGAFVDASLGLYLNGNLYTTAYNDLVNKIGHNFCAGVIKEYGDSTITDYDCVVNQADMTFRLPLLNGSETKGSGSLYFKLGNALQNLQMIDCAQVLSELNQRATTQQVDGEWVSTPITYLSRATSGNVIIDVTGLIPDDGYHYELMMAASQGGSNAGAVSISTCGMNSIGVLQYQGRSQVRVPVDASRKFTLNRAGNNASSFDLCLFGYRRIGTNQ